MTFREHLQFQINYHQNLVDDYRNEIRGLIYYNIMKEYQRLLETYDEMNPRTKK